MCPQAHHGTSTRPVAACITCLTCIVPRNAAYAPAHMPLTRYLIVNVCAHYEKNRMGDISGDVIAAVQWAHETYTAAFAEAGTQLVWKSCTTPQDNVRERLDEEERKIAEYAAATGSLLVYDTRTVIQAATNQHLVTTWSPGEVHYLQFMYEQWNDLLLNILCPDREGAASAAGAADPDCEGVPPPSGAEGE